jgi:hypothetical protein
MPMIPMDDIMEYYGKSDDITKRMISMLLQDPNMLWWVSFVSPKRIEEMNAGSLSPNDYIGYGLYKSPGNILPVLILNGLTPLLRNAQVLKEVCGAISSWIATGGDDLLNTITSQVEEIWRQAGRNYFNEDDHFDWDGPSEN